MEYDNQFKNQYHKVIGERLSNAAKKLGLSQQDILKKCKKMDYAISQPTISKIFSGSGGTTLCIVQISNALDLNVSEVLSMDLEKTDVTAYFEIIPTDSSGFITDADNSDFRAYLGSYHMYFYTTKSEDTIHHGLFSLKKDTNSNKCIADFHFKTGDRNESGIEIEKQYFGPVYYSDKMQAIYCELTSEEIREKCYIVMHYDHIVYQNLECRLASAATVSCGIRRLPTIHKLLLTRKELSDEELWYLSGQLKLNSSEILLSENAYYEFLRDPKLPPKFFDYFGKRENDADRFLSSVAKVSYFSFNESLISDSFLPTLDKTKIICLLRKYSASPKYNKISEKADEIIYKYLELSHRESNTQIAPTESEVVS